MKICRKGMHANKPAVSCSIAVSILLEGENLKQKTTERILPVVLWKTDCLNYSENGD